MRQSRPSEVVLIVDCDGFIAAVELPVSPEEMTTRASLARTSTYELIFAECITRLRLGCVVGGEIDDHRTIVVSRNCRAAWAPFPRSARQWGRPNTRSEAGIVPDTSLAKSREGRPGSERSTPRCGGVAGVRARPGSSVPVKPGPSHADDDEVVIFQVLPCKGIGEDAVTPDGRPPWSGRPY